MKFLLDNMLNLRGITKKELAKRLKVTLVTIYNWCSYRNNALPTSDKLDALCTVLDCKIEDILEAEIVQEYLSKDTYLAELQIENKKLLLEIEAERESKRIELLKIKESLDFQKKVNKELSNKITALVEENQKNKITAVPKPQKPEAEVKKEVIKKPEIKREVKTEKEVKADLKAVKKTSDTKTPKKAKTIKKTPVKKVTQTAKPVNQKVKIQQPKQQPGKVNSKIKLVEIKDIKRPLVIDESNIIKLPPGASDGVSVDWNIRSALI